MTTSRGRFIQNAGYHPNPAALYGQAIAGLFEGTFINARNHAMMEYMGTEATLYADRGRFEVIPENDKVKYQELILGAGGKGADFYNNPPGGLLHLQNWMDCIRSRQTPNAPAEAGVSAAAGAHLGNLAYRNRRVEKWDA